MPAPYVDITAQPFPAWDALLDALADVVRLTVKPGVTGARVYSHWIYELDVASMLGKITGPMKAEGGTSNGKVHCWFMGISEARYVLNQGGDSPIVGGQNTFFTWRLIIDLWGIRDYNGTAASQKAAQDEARMVSAAIYRNADVLRSNLDGVTEVKALQYTSMQPTPFSGGELLSVASGIMEVTVNEALGI